MQSRLRSPCSEAAAEAGVSGKAARFLCEQHEASGACSLALAPRDKVQEASGWTELQVSPPKTREAEGLTWQSTAPTILGFRILLNK